VAILTNLTLDDVRAPLLAFGLEARTLEGLLAGSVNSNFRVTTDRGVFFVRLYEEQDPRGAEREAELLDELRKRNLPVVPPLATKDGRFVIATAGKPLAVFPFVAGAHRCQASVAEGDVFRVGAALAAVHRVGEDLTTNPGLTAPSRFDVAALLGRLDALEATRLPDDVAEARRTLMAELASLRVWSPRSTEVPLVHGDLFRDNVLFAGDGSLHLLDFESASIGLAAFDLMVTVLAFTYGSEWQRPLARALVEGYRSARRLPPNERADLFDAGRLACARFASTRITDYELRPRGVGVYKDFRRWLRRRDALTALGPGGLLEFLGLDPA
jgi:homoserine kinase type II